MADKSASQRKEATTRNIKKLRTASMVCSLTSSWQRWVTENETKQANEPSGWSPSCIGEATAAAAKESRKTWKPKADQAGEAPQTQVGVPKTATPREDARRASLVDGGEEVPGSRIKTKQVVKTVTSSAQEKSAGVGLLSQKMAKDAMPSNDEIDRMLRTKSSPTRRRKCSNMVSSLTKSWKEAEKQQKAPEDGEDGDAGGEDGRGTTAGVEDQAGQSQGDPEIKRPPALMCRKESEDANKINALSKKYSAVGSLKSRWQNWASEHTVNQKLNPFSEYFDYDYSMSLRIQKGEEGYGRPKEGTKTAERAKRAEKHIHREIDDMCLVIRTMANPGGDGRVRVTFGELFNRYVRISDKVVGILMRARKHGKVAFEGEMLWQGQDDAVVITLLV